MRTIKSIKALRKIIQLSKLKKQSIGFVPTMGDLHAGHQSLLKKARKENDIVVLSIFINPTQFAPHEDYNKYPRAEKNDKKLANKEKVDILFFPTVEEMYPHGSLITIDSGVLAERLCGEYRPGHFNGVATVIAKFLNIVDPDVLYLGQKDAQQALILKRMIAQLNFPSRIKICPTVREPDGLALSSRNKYLSNHDRQEAVILFRSLKKANDLIARGERNRTKIIQSIRQILKESSSAEIQYIDCVNAQTLEPLETIKGQTLIALAVFFGNTRLIDNILVRIK